MRRYVDARTAALIDARRVLRINELDARAVLYIASHAGTRPGDLSAFLGITSAGVTTLIDRLVGRGIVRRDVDPHDRRVNRITIEVELAEEPWSVLTRFDDAFDAAVASNDGASVALVAQAVTTFTRAATLATRSA